MPLRMHFTTSIYLLILLPGVLSAPLDNDIDTYPGKISSSNENVPSAIVSDDSSLIKDKILSSGNENEKGVNFVDSHKDAFYGDSLNLEKNKSNEDKSQISLSSKPENNIDSVLKNKKHQAVVEASADNGNVLIDQEIEKKKSKEIFKKPVDSALTPQDGILKDETPLQNKENVSATIKNLITLMIKAPLDLVKAFKAFLEGLVFGGKPISSVTTTTVTAGAP